MVLVDVSGMVVGVNMSFRSRWRDPQRPGEAQDPAAGGGGCCLWRRRRAAGRPGAACAEAGLAARRSGAGFRFLADELVDPAEGAVLHCAADAGRQDGRVRQHLREGRQFRDSASARPWAGQTCKYARTGTSLIAS